jgi:hypothetical protein
VHAVFRRRGPHAVARLCVTAGAWCDKRRLRELHQYDDVAFLNYEYSMLGLLRTFLIDPMTEIARVQFLQLKKTLLEHRVRALHERF